VRKKIDRQLVTIYGVAAVLIVFALVSRESFRSLTSIGNLMAQAAPIGVVALGQTLVLLVAGIDLSVGAVASASTAIGATLINSSPQRMLLGVLAIFAFSAVVGLSNGFLVSFLNLHPLIATLSTSIVITGVTLLLLPYPGGYVDYNFSEIFNTRVFGLLPLSFVYLIILFVILLWILGQTAFGRHLYATGGNAEKARIVGVNVKKVRMLAYLICSVLAGFGGLLLSARMYSGDPYAGTSFTLSSISAALIGGVSFAGGRGNIAGTMAGIIIISMLSMLLNLFGVSPFYQNIMEGSILIVAVMISVAQQTSSGRKNV